MEFANKRSKAFKRDKTRCRLNGT